MWVVTVLSFVFGVEVAVGRNGLEGLEGELAELGFLLGKALRLNLGFRWGAWGRSACSSRLRGLEAGMGYAGVG